MKTIDLIHELATPRSCAKGHLLTPERSYHRPDGGIRCRTCSRNAQRRRRGWTLRNAQPLWIRRQTADRWPTGESQTAAKVREAIAASRAARNAR